MIPEEEEIKAIVLDFLKRVFNEDVACLKIMLQQQKDQVIALSPLEACCSYYNSIRP
jgi:hypothetical protein